MAALAGTAALREDLGRGGGLVLGGTPAGWGGGRGQHWEATGRWSWGGGRGVSPDRLCCRRGG